MTDLTALQPSELAAEASLSLQEAASVLQQLQGAVSAPKHCQTALDLLEEEKTLPCVATFVRRLDEMLGSGVAMCKITEFCGAPGLGKTQLGIQLAVNVHTPSFLDGPSGHCIYIDSEGSFIPERVAAIAQSFVQHVRGLAENRTLSAVEQQEMGAHSRRESSLDWMANVLIRSRRRTVGREHHELHLLLSRAPLH